jgi:hypothetical protein
MKALVDVVGWLGVQIREWADVLALAVALRIWWMEARRDAQEPVRTKKHVARWRGLRRRLDSLAKATRVVSLPATRVASVAATSYLVATTPVLHRSVELVRQAVDIAVG